jgi:hypothetical protein
VARAGLCSTKNTPGLGGAAPCPCSKCIQNGLTASAAEVVVLLFTANCLAEWLYSGSRIQSKASCLGIGRAARLTGRAFSAKMEAKNARGAQENLWPKFFLWSAPLRATSSVSVQSTLGATLKLLKTHAAKFGSRVGIAAWGESFTLNQVSGNITAEPLWKSSKRLEGRPICWLGYSDYRTRSTADEDRTSIGGATPNSGPQDLIGRATYQARELSL